jgi:hypothetical protein
MGACNSSAVRLGFRLHMHAHSQAKGQLTLCTPMKSCLNVVPRERVMALVSGLRGSRYSALVLTPHHLC